MTVEELKAVPPEAVLIWKVTRTLHTDVTLASLNRDGHGRVLVQHGGHRSRVKPRDLHRSAGAAVGGAQ